MLPCYSIAYREQKTYFIIISLNNKYIVNKNINFLAILSNFKTVKSITKSNIKGVYIWHFRFTWSNKSIINDGDMNVNINYF